MGLGFELRQEPSVLGPSISIPPPLFSHITPYLTPLHQYQDLIGV